tara:strand:- start:157 stop:375 length:219 start_codon:yes stop_codon:yes gene_type:complete
MSESKYLLMITSPQDRIKFCNYLSELGDKLYKNIVEESFYKHDTKQPIQHKNELNNVHNYKHYDIEYPLLFD